MPERINPEHEHSAHHVWDVAEYTQYAHSRLWYTVASLFLLAAVAYALFTANYLFAVIMILIAIVFVYHEVHEPGITQFGITDEGVVWNGFLFQYKEIKSFWIVYNPPLTKNLYIEFKKITTPRLTIPLEDEDPVAVRETLRQYAFEDLSKEDAPASELVGQVLKF